MFLVDFINLMKNRGVITKFLVNNQRPFQASITHFSQQYSNITLHSNFLCSIILIQIDEIYSKDDVLHYTVVAYLQYTLFVCAVVLKLFFQFSRLGPPLPSVQSVKEHPNLEILQVSNLIHFLNPRLRQNHSCRAATASTNALLT